MTGYGLPLLPPGAPLPSGRGVFPDQA